MVGWCVVSDCVYSLGGVAAPDDAVVSDARGSYWNSPGVAAGVRPVSILVVGGLCC